MKPCACCKNKKKPGKTGAEGYGFNRLEGDPRQWAEGNRFARSEYCVPVRGGKKFGGPTWQKVKCGDGTMGFSTRRKGQVDEVRMEEGLDGQYKKKRHTLVRNKSARASASRKARRVDGSVWSLASGTEVHDASRDPMVVAEQKAVERKSRRAKNRNRGAARGWKRSMTEMAIAA